MLGDDSFEFLAKNPFLYNIKSFADIIFYNAMPYLFVEYVVSNATTSPNMW